jgi:OOP family OmpA-OmpF porin
VFSTRQSFAASLMLVSFLLPALAKDIAGGKDHPVVSRYEGSRMLAYSQKNFDEFELILGPQTRDKNDNPAPSKAKMLEGKVTRMVYVAPEGRSTLEVFRNYQNALKSGGFETLFSGAKADELGNLFIFLKYKGEKNMSPTKEAGYAYAFVADERYMAAYRAGQNGEKDVYVSVYTARHNWDHFSSLEQRAITLLEVVEVEPMEGAKVKVTADGLQKSIKKSGKAVIYEIYFDLDQTYPRKDSAYALFEIEKMLKANPNLKVYLVGHTDDTGELDYNLKLSQERANNVVDFLEKQSGIDAGRLIPKGVGPLVPIATNRTEEGRAKNRRVELVEITD